MAPEATLLTGHPVTPEEAWSAPVAQLQRPERSGVFARRRNDSELTPQTLYLHRVLQHRDFLPIGRPKLTPGGREAQSDGHGQLQVHDGHAHDGDPAERQAAQGLAEALPHILREESGWRWTRDPRATSGMGTGVEGRACPRSTLQAQPLGHPRHSPPWS